MEKRSTCREGTLLKGPIPERSRGFRRGVSVRVLAQEWFPGRSIGIAPALIEQPLYIHQEQAIRLLHADDRNAVVATGTASGKTESFLYPILLHLYRQHFTGELDGGGVRALILYPMNAGERSTRTVGRDLPGACGLGICFSSDVRPVHRADALQRRRQISSRQDAGGGLAPGRRRASHSTGRRCQSLEGATRCSWPGERWVRL